MNNKISNKELEKSFFKLVYNCKPSFFLEIGAFDASTSINVAKKLPHTNCVAYEANKYNFEYFKNKVENLPNFTYNNLAISNHNKNVTFFIQRQKNKKKFNPIKQNNSLLERSDPRFMYEEITVKCNTLDSIYSPNETYCLWIDAEGKGYEVLEGAKRILKNTRYIFIEVEEKQFWKEQKLDKDVIEFLATAGFQILLQDQEYENQYNILFEKIK